MSNNNSILDILCLGGAGTSVASLLDNASQIITIIAGVIAIITGLISIILKIVNACKDGKITKEEKEDILSEAEDLKNTIKKE